MTYEAPIEKMIEKVSKKKELKRDDAIKYMMAVATGRLAALWRYDDTLPEGKTSKGIFELHGKKKPAARAGAKPAKAKPKKEAAAVA